MDDRIILGNIIVSLQCSSKVSYTKGHCGHIEMLAPEQTYTIMSASFFPPAAWLSFLKYSDEATSLKGTCILYFFCNPE